MKRPYLYILAGLLLILFTSTQENKYPHEHTYKISFGVKIGLLPTGKLVQYAIIYYSEYSPPTYQRVSFTQFYNIASGKWPLPGTSMFHNFFSDYGLVSDSLEKEEQSLLTAFDSLWKVRFNFHPYNYEQGKGWSQGQYKPSLKQQAYIYNQYGVYGFKSDFFSDTSFFKLLKDVSDPKWVEHYTSLD